MSKIYDIKIENNSIAFTLLSEVQLDNITDYTLTVDECDNICNIYAEDIKYHTYVINNENSTIDMQVIGDNAYSVTIESEEISNMDRNMKHITFQYNYNEQTYTVYGIFYDSKQIYNAEIEKLRLICSVCLDDKVRQLIPVVVFKRQLLEDSIEMGNFEEALFLYIELCRILEIHIDGMECCSLGNKRRILKEDEGSIKLQNGDCCLLEQQCCNGSCCTICNKKFI